MTRYNSFSQQRKVDIDNMVCPKWMSTAGYQMLYEKNYLDHNESIKDRFNGVAGVLSNPKYSILPITHDRVFQMLWNGWLSLPTPALTSIGKDSKGMPVSCTGNYVPDSISGFFGAAKEVAELTKEGFGTSSDLSNIRPRGATVSTGLKAAGVLPVVELMTSATKMVSQGKNRSGAWAGYLTFEHGDFYEFCDYILHNPKAVNAGFILTDKFFTDAKAGDKEAHNRLKTWLKVRFETGTGYLIKRDLIEQRWAKQGKKEKFRASNLCVAPETYVLTDKGNIQIGSLEGKEVTVWNGFEWSKVTVRKTGVNQPLVKVTMDNGRELECTPYHRFAIRAKGIQSKVLIKQANELEKGDKVISHWRPAHDLGTTGITKIWTYGDEVESVQDLGRLSDTYCFTEPKRNMGIFNGILTMNCNEIILPSGPDLSYTCVLSSINVAKWDEFANDPNFMTDAFVVLNAINELFVDKATKAGWGESKELARTLKFSSEYRALGMGVMGWHTYLQSKSCEFKDQQPLNEKFFSELNKAGDTVSKRLAQATGKRAPDCEGYNWAMCAVAPTLSTSLIQGGVSGGIEPVFSNVYTQETAAGAVQRVNPALLKVLKDKGLATQDLFDDINYHNGSVQHLDCLDNKTKAVFKTGFEIDQLEIIRHAAYRQRYIDQGQSVNLFNCNDQAYMSKVHSAALLNNGLLGLYYLLPSDKVLPVPKCESCEA